VNPAVPAKSVSELVALLKYDPDKYTFSSGGFGTPAQLIGEMFKLETGTRGTHVPILVKKMDARRQTLLWTFQQYFNGGMSV
jgi:tripartite-type tricarboxylate transporter receptor subunit TctC